MNKGLTIDNEMWSNILEMFYSNSKEDIFLAVGILSECELDSFDETGCWYMKQILNYVLGNDVDDSIHLFIIRTVQWLKDTKEWEKMRSIEEELKKGLAL
jgi:hypothetical protein